ncbi:MAG: nucleotidyl transferase AbiEii/AbiGii toxin family protein [Ferruginibacter sp.]
MKLPQLKYFYLVGGTSLSLKYGHRISVDLDLFCIEKFDNNIIIEALENEFGRDLEYEGGFSNFGVFCFIHNVKVDLVYYPHPIIYPIVHYENTRMYATEDIAAMKVQAILGRGKKKDFWDLAELLNWYPLKEIISFHQKKYPSQQLLISIPQAISYFEDADESEDPVSLKGQTWEGVKKNIQSHVNNYLK